MFAGLIVYASLYPFGDFARPPVPALVHVLRLPWSTYFTAFDVVANLCGYLPLGLLLFGAVVRSGGGWPRALVVAVVAPALLSYAMEVAQYFLPGRVPSLLDWCLNVGGAAAGALAAAGVQSLGYVDRWQDMRDRWVIRRSGGALALLLLWPVGLLFPPPVPFGLGPPWDRVLEGADAAMEGVPWLEALRDRIAARLPPLEIDPASEWLAMTLGLAAPVLLAYAIVRPGWRRLILAGGATALGFVVTTLSTALNFGPTHALGWITAAFWPALVTALLLSALLASAHQRICAAVGLAVLSALTALVVQAPADPYYAQSLQAWEQGRFIRFHGIAQWVGWLWPPGAIAWLVVRLGAREE